jgi:hypothetical protein
MIARIVPVTLAAALADPLICECDCHATLSLAQRTQGVTALYRLDDAMRGWGYVVEYEIGADRLFRAARDRADPAYRGVAVRDHACVYRRLVGFLVHEVLHALVGTGGAPNHGLPWGLPYGVPAALPATEEASFLDRFNRQEAIAFVGVAPFARAVFAIDWAVYTARDVGTYGFPGGWSVVEVPRGFRPVPHVDRGNQPERYHALARALEASVALDLDDLRARFEAAEARAPRVSRTAPDVVAARPARAPTAKDPCPCGSGRKWRQCCGALAS